MKNYRQPSLIKIKLPRLNVNWSKIQGAVSVKKINPLNERTQRHSKRIFSKTLASFRTLVHVETFT